MVIRRIRDHVATHNWFSVAVDLAIVVVGVFLGLQANNWNSARIDDSQAREYRAQIISDLYANEVDMLRRADYYRQVRAHALAALGVLEDPHAQPGERFLVDAYLATNTNRRPLERSAYDEMVGSGVGRDASGLQTRAKISAYYAQIPQFNENVLAITAYKDRLRRAMPYVVQLRIAERCKDLVHTMASGAQYVTTPDRCSAGLDSGAVAVAVNRLKASDELNLDLTRQLADLDQKLALFHRYARLAHDLRVDLEAEGKGQGQVGKQRHSA